MRAVAALGVLAAFLSVAFLFVKPGRLGWYLLGAGLVVAGLALAVKDGPFDVSTTGYCDSVLEPGYVKVEDAPPGTYERCDEVRRERIPVIGALGLTSTPASGPRPSSPPTWTGHR